MSTAYPPEEFSEREVTYFAEVDGRLVVIERVPARVSRVTGERLYSPETVERIQAIVWGQTPPVRMISAAVYQYSSQPASPGAAVDPGLPRPIAGL